MENLDELMRKKFDNDDPAARFEFREEYWEQAQALIEADEKRRRKRRRWLLWWIFAAALAVCGWQWAAGGWQWGRDGGSGSSRGRGREQSAEPAGTGTLAGEGGRQGVTAGDTFGQHASAGTGILKKDADSTLNFDSNEKTSGTAPAVLNNNIENQSFKEKERRQESLSATERGAGKSNGKPQTPPVSASKKSAASPSVTARDNNSGKRADALPSPEQRVARTGKDEQSVHSGEQADLLPPPDRTDSVNEAAVAQRSPYEPLDLLALPALRELLALPARALDTPFAKPYLRPIKPVRERKFSFGLTAAGTLSQASPDGKRLGAVGGLLAHCRLSGAWSLTAGVHWRYLTGKWASDTIPSASEQLHYRFGYQQDMWHLETRGLHFIEIPIGVRWRRGAFAAEGGFAPGVLLGVQGRLTQQHSESLQENVTTESSRVWLNKTPYNRFSPALFLGGEWRVVQHIGLALRGTYRPGTFGQKLIPDEPPPANLFWLDAGLRWYF